MKHSTREQQGFTLIEMLAAVAILAIAMAAVISGLARYVDNTAYLREKTIALWVAHNRLTEIDLQPTWPELGKADGKLPMAGRDWKWQTEVKATEDPQLRRVDIEVTSADGQGTAARLSAFLAATGRQ